LLRIEAAKRRGLRLFKSLSFLGDAIRNQQQLLNTRVRPIFITLTYSADAMWSPNHISSFCHRLRVHAARRGFKAQYVWVAEQTESGRVHYHAIVWLPKGERLPKPDQCGWWPHGSSRIEWARKGIGYLVKYATKGDAKYPFPCGCRLHGHGGIDAECRTRRSWWMLPKYIRELCQPELKVRRCHGGGWISPITGEWWAAMPLSAINGSQ